MIRGKMSARLTMRVFRVFDSCKTLAQLRVAKEYARLACRPYSDTDGGCPECGWFNQKYHKMRHHLELREVHHAKQS